MPVRAAETRSRPTAMTTFHAIAPALCRGSRQIIHYHQADESLTSGRTSKQLSHLQPESMNKSAYMKLKWPPI